MTDAIFQELATGEVMPTGNFTVMVEEEGTFRLEGWVVQVISGRHGVAIQMWKRPAADVPPSKRHRLEYHRLFASWDRIESMLAATRDANDGGKVDLKGSALYDAKNYAIAKGLA